LAKPIDFSDIRYGIRRPKSERGKAYRKFLLELLSKPIESVLPYAIDRDPVISSLVKMRILLVGKSATKQKGVTRA